MATEHALYINGEPHLRMDPRRAPPVFEDATAHATWVADATEAIVQAHAANTDTPMDPSIAAAAADWCWWRFISLRPTQLEALIAIRVNADRCDASEISMITGVPISQVNAIKRKAVAAKEKADELAAEAAAAAVPAAAPAAAPVTTAAATPVAETAVEDAVLVPDPAATAEAAAVGTVTELAPAATAVQVEHVVVADATVAGA